MSKCCMSKITSITEKSYYFYVLILIFLVRFNNDLFLIFEYNILIMLLVSIQMKVENKAAYKMEEFVLFEIEVI